MTLESAMTSNSLLWVGFILLDLGLVTLIYRFFGKTGLYVVIVASIITANIQVVKTVEIFGFVATLGNVLYGSIFFSTDILNEVYMAWFYRDAADDAVDAAGPEVYPSCLRLCSGFPVDHLWFDAQDCRRQHGCLSGFSAPRYLGFPLLEEEDQGEVPLAEEQRIHYGGSV